MKGVFLATIPLTAFFMIKLSSTSKPRLLATLIHLLSKPFKDGAIFNPYNLKNLLKILYTTGFCVLEKIKSEGKIFILRS